MGNLLQNRTPAQLAWILAASNLVVASSFGTFFVESYRHSSSHRLSPLEASVSFALLILGMIMGLFAETALKDGIASEEWPEALVAGTRKFFTHSALAAAFLLLAVGAFAVFVLSSRHFSGAWIFIYPLMTLSRIRGFFSRPPNSAGGPGTQDPPKPLRSDHWGIPPQRFSR
jgi:hypothetical protein